jgi:hypothetical protein
VRWGAVAAHIASDTHLNGGGAERRDEVSWDEKSACM